MLHTISIPIPIPGGVEFADLCAYAEATLDGVKNKYRETHLTYLLNYELVTRLLGSIGSFFFFFRLFGIGLGQ